jgi:16S rRNA (cytosine967-C5)-methyltransferase
VATGRNRASGSGRTGRPRPARPPAGGRKASARELALRVIRRVTEEGAYSNLALAAELRRSSLPPRDRAFAADLVRGTLRRLLPLDRAIASASSRPLAAVDPPALALLRLGAYQLLEAGVAPHAAVGETVALASGRHRGFVNAVLRGLADHPPEPASDDDDDAVSLRTGLSPWAVGELRRLLPPEEVEPAAHALGSPASLSLRVNRCRTEPGRVMAALRDAGLEPAPGRLHPDAVLVAGGVVAEFPGFAHGWFAVQDQASMLVAAAAGVRPGHRVLDACAGPGGKATHLACLAQPGGMVVAADVHPARSALVSRAAGRLGVPVRVLAQDARRPAVKAGFDVALVDAPCSGLGAARRRPELLWRPSKADLAHLARLQVAILSEVAGLVRRGGRLVYAVCTFPRAETDAAVRAFLSKRPDFVADAVPGPDGPAPTHRLWPHRHGTDAMFIAGFRRVGEEHRPAGRST